MCPNPSKRLRSVSTELLPGVITGTCTQYADLPGYRSLVTAEDRDQLRMTDHYTLRNSGQISSDAGGSCGVHWDVHRRADSLDHGSDHLADLDFTVGSNWPNSTLPPVAPVSSWSNYTFASNSFPTSSSGWEVPPLEDNITVTFPSNVTFPNHLSSGISAPNNFTNTLPQSLQLETCGSASIRDGFFSSGLAQARSGNVQHLYQTQPLLINAEPGNSLGKIADAVPSHQHQHVPQFDMPQHRTHSFSAHNASENVKDQFAGLDEDAVSQWVDGMIRGMMEVMPGMPIEHLFANLSEALAPGYVNAERVIRSRLHPLYASARGRVQNTLPIDLARAGKRPRVEYNDGAKGQVYRENANSSQNTSQTFKNAISGLHDRQENVMQIQAAVSHPSPELREDQQLPFSSSQKRTDDNLQLSLEPADERSLRHLHTTRQPSLSKFGHQGVTSRDSPGPSHLKQYPQIQPHYHQKPKLGNTILDFDVRSSVSQCSAQNARDCQGLPSLPLDVPQTSSQKRQSHEPSTSQEGLQLLALLLQCAEAVSSGNHDEANTILPQLREQVTPYGSSVQRVVAYFAEGMASRLVTSCLGINSPLPRNDLVNNPSFTSAIQVFNEICPFVKFSHFTAIQAISEAFEGMNNVHVIDMDIMHGLQWHLLLQNLAKRPGGPPHVHITGLGTSVETLDATGKRLIDFAATLGVSFQFTAVAEKFGKLDPSALKVEFSDALAVHWMHHSLYDVSGCDSATLGLMHKLSPKIITIVEQDLRHGGPFLNRFVEALHYYSALFDSLGASYNRKSLKRHMVEQQLLSCEIKNILAIGGPGRSGTTKFDHWRDKLSEAGFNPVALSAQAVHQAALLLSQGFYPGEGYTLLEDLGALKLGWEDLCLFTASAWTST